MSDPLYKKELLRLAADAHGAGRLACASAIGHAHNPVCGDKVVVDLVLEDGRVVEIRQDAKACVLTQASASILGFPGRGRPRPVGAASSWRSPQCIEISSSGSNRSRRAINGNGSPVSASSEKPSARKLRSL